MINVMCSKFSSPYLLANYDATAFKLISEYTETKKKVLVVIEEKTNMPTKVLPGTKGHVLNYFIKVFCVVTVACVLCPKLVFLVAAPQMVEGMHVCYPVAGLSTSVTPEAVGYLCFAKTKNGTPSFFEFLNTVVLIPILFFSISDTLGKKLALNKTLRFTTSIFSTKRGQRHFYLGMARFSIELA